jgi:tripeptidyl-peptidase-1
MQSLLLAAVPVALATSIAPRWDDTRVKHSWGTIPAKWEHYSHPPAGATIDLHIVLKPHQEDALIDELLQVSDPLHHRYVPTPSYPHKFTFIHGCIYCQHRYGAHLSEEEVAELVSPHPDTLDLVTSWLEHNNVPTSLTSITHGRSWLTLTGLPVSQANALLGVSYQLYRHTETSETVLRTTSYALPDALHDHVQTIAPTTYFGSPTPFRQTSHTSSNAFTLPNGDLDLQRELESFSLDSPAPVNCSNVTTPSCLRMLYKTGGYVPRVPSRNGLGIAGYLGNFVSGTDLKEFMTLFRPDAVGSQISIVNVNGSINDEKHPSKEARILLSMSLYVFITCNHTGQP